MNEDEQVLAVYLDAIGRAQAMDRVGLRRRAAEEFETERIADRVIGAFARIRESATFGVTDDTCSQEI